MERKCKENAIRIKVTGQKVLQKGAAKRLVQKIRLQKNGAKYKKVG